MTGAPSPGPGDVAIIIMGLSYSLLASALWPIAALVIPEHQLGTAYGLMQAIQNLGLALITMLAGLIVDQHGYIWLELFFIFWLVVALIATINITSSINIIISIISTTNSTGTAVPITIAITPPPP